MVLTIIAIFVKVKLTYRKVSSKAYNINIYERELPSNLRPAHVRFLLNDGLIDKVSFYVTILDLIDRKYIELINNKEIGKTILRKTNKNHNNLLKFEKFLIDWIIEKYGENNEVSFEKIYDSLTNNIYKEQPNKLFTEWQGLTLVSFPLEKYYKKTNGIINKNYFYLIIAGVLLWKFFGMFLIIYSVGCMLYVPLVIANQEGAEEKDRWLDLKKYLEDFSQIKDRNIEMIQLWEFYLTYAVALDMVDNVNKELEIVIGDNLYNIFQEENVENDKVCLLEYRPKVISNDDIKEIINNEAAKYNLPR